MDGSYLVELAKSVRTRADFVKFVGQFVLYSTSHPEEWSNSTLTDFLSGLRGFADEMDGYYRNTEEGLNPDLPSWRLFADMLLAARIYEG